jgi:general secretion pathway protein I
MGALGLLSQAGAGASPLAGASSIGDVAKTLADANQQAIAGAAPPPGSPGSVSSSSGAPGADPAAAGMGGLASMAMSFVYPSLKLLFEASTRRITASVTFRSGKKDNTVEVTEWFTVPQKGLTVDDQSAQDTTTNDTNKNTNTNKNNNKRSP